MRVPDAQGTMTVFPGKAIRIKVGDPRAAVTTGCAPGRCRFDRRQQSAASRPAGRRADGFGGRVITAYLRVRCSGDRGHVFAGMHRVSRTIGRFTNPGGRRHVTTVGQCRPAHSPATGRDGRAQSGVPQREKRLGRRGGREKACAQRLSDCSNNDRIHYDMAPSIE